MACVFGLLADAPAVRAARATAPAANPAVPFSSPVS
jgi:hypothetical protein